MLPALRGTPGAFRCAEVRHASVLESGVSVDSACGSLVKARQSWTLVGQMVGKMSRSETPHGPCLLAVNPFLSASPRTRVSITCPNHSAIPLCFITAVSRTSTDPFLSFDHHVLGVSIVPRVETPVPVLAQVLVAETTYPINNQTVHEIAPLP